MAKSWMVITPLSTKHRPMPVEVVVEAVASVVVVVKMVASVAAKVGIDDRQSKVESQRWRESKPNVDESGA